MAIGGAVALAVAVAVTAVFAGIALGSACAAPFAPLPITTTPMTPTIVPTAPITAISGQRFFGIAGDAGTRSGMALARK